MFRVLTVACARCLAYIFRDSVQRARNVVPRVSRVTTVQTNRSAVFVLSAIRLLWVLSDVSRSAPIGVAKRIAVCPTKMTLLDFI